MPRSISPLYSSVKRTAALAAGCDSLYSTLLALATAQPEERFYPGAHTALCAFLDAPVMIVALADSASFDGLSVRYRRDLEQRSTLPALDPALLRHALGSTGTTVYDPLPFDGVDFGRPASDRVAGASAVVAPMLCDGRLLGYFALRSPRRGAFDARALPFVRAAADVAALVARNKIASDEAQARGQELRLMLETARALSTERDLPRLFTRFHQLVAGVMDAGTFWIALAGDDAATMDVPYCVDQHRMVDVGEALPLDGSLSGFVFESGEALLMRTREDWDAYPSFERGEGDDLMSALVVPLRIGSRIIGAMSVQSTRSHAYTERDRDLLVAIAEQTAVAVENSRAFTRADQRARELAMLAEVSRALSAQLSLKALFRTVCEQVRRVMDAPVFFVAMLSRDGRQMQAEYCMEGDKQIDIGDQPIENSFSQQVYRSNRPMVLNSAAEIASQPYRLIATAELRVKSVAMVPLRLGDRCIGVMSAQSYGAGAYDPARARLLAAIAEQLALAVHNARLFGDARERAERDPLTNLYHHRYLTARLEDDLVRAAASGSAVTVLMLDVDNFKLVNDTYGHPSGDDALRLLTNALLAACRSDDVVGRYGGDEFMVILADAEVGLTIAERIRTELSERVLAIAGSSGIPVSCSIGLASYPADGAEAADLIGKADAALYQSKRLGRPADRLHRVGSTKMCLDGDFEPVSELLAALLARDPATRSHLEHVNRVAKEFACVVGLNAADTHALLLASVLHDVGKIAVPDRVLRKPGKLTPEEFAIVRRHPELGAMLIENYPGYAGASVAVLHHHERYDGKGYPAGIAGLSIPLVARIVTLIDAFSAMIIDRPYHKGMTTVEALGELRAGAGGQFDPMLVAKFVAMVDADGGR